jgi:murein DD-endopeptidase MepM/ murein hydrolase activator NlpD
VKAVFDGKIVKIENSMMNGTVVHLKVSDSLTVVYKGLGSNVSVKEGDVVKKGAKIGRIVGFLAEKADGVHLHLEVLKDKKLVDPTEYFSFSK